MSTTDSLSSNQDTAPADRFCDLVMKGGITSGVVYPLAITELARHYRFKNIGGTSAGAVAAALTAAAEFRRRHGSTAGFAQLAALPQQLGEPIGGQTRLRAVFQPSERTQRLLAILLATLNRTSTASRWLGFFAGVLRSYAWALFAGVLVAIALVWIASAIFGGNLVLSAILASLMLGPAAIALAIYRDVVRGLVPNGFGICNGYRGLGGRAHPAALVNWLHERIQTLAGRTLEEAPLTFRDLWDAPGFPPTWLKPSNPAQARSINLQMFTTNLMHRRPYHLPFEDATSRLFFSPSELLGYFPENIVDYLVRHAKRYQPLGPSDPPPSMAPVDLLELPAADLPIVVATRLSLSFPFLFSAVPLWAIDYEPKRAERTLKRCWFSDGGICSNFPIHLFDSLLPSWPTFGIQLDKRSEFRKGERTWLPLHHYQGRGDTWLRFDDKPTAIGRLGGFILSVAASAQNWNDMTGMRMPGVRDRVVHTLLLESEGGFNLAMDADSIANLSRYGQEAGVKLAEKFAAAGDGSTLGWNEHRWVRLNVTIQALRERIAGLAAAATLNKHAQPLAAQIEAAIGAAPLEDDELHQLTSVQAQSLKRLLEALQQLESAFERENTTPQPYQPSPNPTVRVRPPL